MKVKVAYTLGIEEVPALIEDIISDCRKSLVDQSERLRIPIHSHEKIYETINQVRKKMALVDSKLEDCVSLADGYFNAISEQTNPAVSTSNDEVSYISQDDTDE